MESIINLQVVGNMVLPKNTNIKTINGISLIATKYDTNIDGLVTDVSIATANGFAGSTSGGTTPVLTLRTTVSGIVKGNGTAISSAVDGTDYLSPSTGVTLSQSVAQTIGTTSNRVLKLWATDITVTNSISGSITGNAGSATILQTARNIYGNSFNGSASLTQIIASTFGGTGNGFVKFSGTTTTEKTKTLTDANDTILELSGSYSPSGTWTSLKLVTPVLGTPSSGTLTNCDGYKLNNIVASSAVNTINNVSYQQEWQWNSLAGSSGLKLSSTSTAAASNTQKLLEVSLTGANATGSQTTYAGYIDNRHTGSGSVNVGAYINASGGGTNYGLLVANGHVGIGTTAPTNPNGSGVVVHVESSTGYPTILVKATSSSGGAFFEQDSDTGLLGFGTYGSGVGGTAGGIARANNSIIYCIQQLTIYTTTTKDLTLGANATPLLTLKSNGNVVLGNETALATSATTGFAYIPTCAGTPTGVPTAYTGKVPIVFDTTNKKLYIYSGSWLGGTVPGVFI